MAQQPQDRDYTPAVGVVIAAAAVAYINKGLTPDESWWFIMSIGGMIATGVGTAIACGWRMTRRAVATDMTKGHFRGDFYAREGEEGPWVNTSANWLTGSATYIAETGVTPGFSLAELLRIADDYAGIVVERDALRVALAESRETAGDNAEITGELRAAGTQLAATEKLYEGLVAKAAKSDIVLRQQELEIGFLKDQSKERLDMVETLREDNAALLEKLTATIMAAPIPATTPEKTGETVRSPVPTSPDPGPSCGCDYCDEDAVGTFRVHTGPGNRTEMQALCHQHKTANLEMGTLLDNKDGKPLVESTPAGTGVE